MKKCFTLTMLLVAALVLPAGAVAPIIDDLPVIVVGDNEGDGMINQDALDVNAVVDWTLGGSANLTYLDSASVFFLTTTLDAVITGNGAPNITAGDLTALDAGTAPPSAANVNNQADGLVDVESDTAVNATNDVTFVATISDSTGWTTGSQSVLEVETVVGGSDVDGWGIRIGLGAFDQFRDATDNPGFTNGGGGGYGDALPAESTSGGLGFNVTSMSPGSLGVAYGVWKPTVDDVIFFIDNDAGGALASPVFELKATMKNDSAPAYANGPGYRLFILNSSFTHAVGLIVMNTIADETGANGASAGNNFTAKLYWELPSLAGFGDGGALDAFDGSWTSPQTFFDGRDYGVQFEVISWANDTGLFSLETLGVLAFENAMTATANTLSYTNFSDWATFGGSPFGFGDGTATAGATLVMNAGSGLSAILANPAVYTDGVSTDMDVAPGMMVRSTIQAASADEDTAGCIRLLNALQNEGRYNGGVSPDRWISWFEMWGAFSPAYKVPGTLPPGGTAVNPAPAAAGSTLHTYCWVENVSTDAYNVPATPDFMTPQLAVFGIGAYVGDSVWSDNNGNITFSSLALEEVSSDTGRF